MSYAIELYFDPETDDAVRQIWRSISDGGLESPMFEADHRPHVSLAVYDSDELVMAELEQNLVAFAEKLAPFSLELGNVGIFPTGEGVVFLGVTVTRELLEVHASFHTAFENYVVSLRPYYRVGSWVPHCTLASGMSAEACAAVIPLCWQATLPLRGQVREIGITKVSPVSCDLLSAYHFEEP